MRRFTDLEETREYFKNDRFATDNGMQIDEVKDTKTQTAGSWEE